VTYCEDLRRLAAVEALGAVTNMLTAICEVWNYAASEKAYQGETAAGRLGQAV